MLCNLCEAWLTDSGMDLVPCNRAPKSGMFSIVEDEKLAEVYHVHHEMPPCDDGHDFKAPFKGTADERRWCERCGILERDA